MKGQPNRDKLIAAVHALTGRWISGESGALLAERTGSREELLAHGFIDLDWLQRAPGVRRQFAALASAAAIPAVAGEDVAASPPARSSSPLSRGDALSLTNQFYEAPTDADPFDMLRQLSVSRLTRSK